MREWFGVDTKQVTSPEFLRIDPALRGHWQALLGHCAERQNGGVITGARAWSARDWDRAAAVTSRSVTKLVEVGLAEWRGDDLVIVGYDAAREKKQLETSEKRSNAAKTRWPSDANASANADAKPAEVQVQVQEQTPPAAPAPVMQRREEEKREEKRRTTDPLKAAQIAKEATARIVAALNTALKSSYPTEQPWFIEGSVGRALEAGIVEADVVAAALFVARGWKGVTPPQMKHLIGDGLQNNVAAWRHVQETARPAGDVPDALAARRAELQAKRMRGERV